MIVEYEVDLRNKTTFGVGGICKEFYVPQSIDELIQLKKEYPGAHMLAGGSNIVIDDRKEFDVIISLLEFNKSICKIEDGVYCVGASARNQKVIKHVNSEGYGGIEYLYSVPGTIGGAIYMNAGTGKKPGNYISQNIISVDWFDGKEIKTINRNECEFDYRTSIFQKKSGVIISAKIRFDCMTKEETQLLIEKRMERVKKRQDHSGRTCGTFCKMSNRNVMRLLKLLKYGDKEGVHYSSKTPNWLINEGKGNFIQFEKCVKIANIIHKVFGKSMELEIEVW